MHWDHFEKFCIPLLHPRPNFFNWARMHHDHSRVIHRVCSLRGRVTIENCKTHNSQRECFVSSSQPTCVGPVCEAPRFVSFFVDFFGGKQNAESIFANTKGPTQETARVSNNAMEILVYGGKRLTKLASFS